MPVRRVVPRVSIPEWVPWAVREHGLTPATGMVLVSMCVLADSELLCEQSLANIGQNVGIARSAVQAGVARLIEISAIVELERSGRNAPSRFRISAAQPPTAAQLRLLGTLAKRRATLDGSGWLVSVD